MKVLTPEALHRYLESGKRGGVFFLFGDEEFLKDEATNALIGAHLDPATRDFNYDQLRAGEITPEALASIIATPPMMAEWRVVVLRDVHALGTAPRLRSTLESLLEKPIPGLLLIMNAAAPSGRPPQFYENLKKKAVPVECTALSDADLPGWLMERAHARGVELEPEAARLLAASIGSDLGVLLQELNKLCSYAADKGTIERAMVASMVGRVARQDRWQWFDLVTERKFREARRGLEVLLDAGESGVGLVIGLGTQFLRLAIGVAGGQRALEEALPSHQKWLASRIARQVRGWSLEGVEQALDDLQRADRLLKSTPLTETQVMEELLLRLQTRASQVAA